MGDNPITGEGEIIAPVNQHEAFGMALARLRVAPIDKGVGSTAMVRSGSLLAGFGQLAWIGLATVALYAFLQDFMSPDWPAWILSPLLLIGFRGAIAATREHDVARAALWQGALLIVPFMAIYGLLDVFFSSDGPVWLLSPLIVVGLWLLFSQVVDVESE